MRRGVVTAYSCYGELIMLCPRHQQPVPTAQIFWSLLACHELSSTLNQVDTGVHTFVSDLGWTDRPTVPTRLCVCSVCAAQTTGDITRHGECGKVERDLPMFFFFLRSAVLVLSLVVLISCYGCVDVRKCFDATVSVIF